MVSQVRLSLLYGYLRDAKWICGLELLNLLQQSLRSKVATLEEDNWMFETEDDPLV